MEDNYYLGIKCERGNIRNQRSILAERANNLDFYKNPFLYLKEFLSSGSISRINSIKEKVILREKELYKKDISLKKEYSKRLKHLKNYELKNKYEEVLRRVRDLDSRADKVEEKMLRVRGNSKRRIELLLREIKSVKSGGNENLMDIVREFESNRGISLEQFYMNDYPSEKN